MSFSGETSLFNANQIIFNNLYAEPHAQHSLDKADCPAPIYGVGQLSHECVSQFDHGWRSDLTVRSNSEMSETSFNEPEPTITEAEFEVVEGPDFIKYVPKVGLVEWTHKCRGPSLENDSLVGVFSRIAYGSDQHKGGVVFRTADFSVCVVDEESNVFHYLLTTDTTHPPLPNFHWFDAWCVMGSIHAYRDAANREDHWARILSGSLVMQPTVAIYDYCRKLDWNEFLPLHDQLLFNVAYYGRLILNFRCSIAANRFAKNALRPLSMVPTLKDSIHKVDYEEMIINIFAEDAFRVDLPIINFQRSKEAIKLWNEVRPVSFILLAYLHRDGDVFKYCNIERSVGENYKYNARIIRDFRNTNSSYFEVGICEDFSDGFAKCYISSTLSGCKRSVAYITFPDYDCDCWLVLASIINHVNGKINFHFLLSSFNSYAIAKNFLTGKYRLSTVIRDDNGASVISMFKGDAFYTRVVTFLHGPRRLLGDDDRSLVCAALLIHACRVVPDRKVIPGRGLLPSVLASWRKGKIYVPMAKLSDGNERHFTDVCRSVQYGLLATHQDFHSLTREVLVVKNSFVMATPLAVSQRYLESLKIELDPLYLDRAVRLIADPVRSGEIIALRYVDKVVGYNVHFAELFASLWNRCSDILVTRYSAYPLTMIAACFIVTIIGFYDYEGQFDADADDKGVLDYDDEFPMHYPALLIRLIECEYLEDMGHKSFCGIRVNEKWQRHAFCNWSN